MSEPNMEITESTEFAYCNTGYGLQSFELGNDFQEYRDGKLFTGTFDSEGMQWNGKRWEFDGGLGMKTEVYFLSEMTPKQIAELEQDYS